MNVRRGPGGGYFTTRPDISAVVHMAAIRLQLEHVAIGEILASTSTLRRELAPLAALNMDEEGYAKLAAFLEHDRAIDEKDYGFTVFLKDEIALGPRRNSENSIYRFVKCQIRAFEHANVAKPIAPSAFESLSLAGAIMLIGNSIVPRRPWQPAGEKESRLASPRPRTGPESVGDRRRLHADEGWVSLLWPRRRRRIDRHDPCGDRPWSDLFRYRGNLWTARQRAAAGSGHQRQARWPRSGHQVGLPLRRRNPLHGRRRLARQCSPCHRRVAEAPRDGSGRPLLPAPDRSQGPHRGDYGRAGRAGPRRQGASRRSFRGKRRDDP